MSKKPKWKINMFREMYGDEWVERWLKNLNKPPTKTARFISLDELRKKDEERGN